MSTLTKSQLPKGVAQTLNEWLSGDYEILHAWGEDNFAFRVIAQTRGVIYFLRVFKLHPLREPPEYVLSQDGRAELEEFRLLQEVVEAYETEGVRGTLIRKIRRIIGELED